jgi:murein L,D-transpeptidase YafK
MRKKWFIVILTFLGLIIYFIIKPPYFILNKLKESKTVKEAISDIEHRTILRLESDFIEKGVSLDNFELSLLAFKEEQLLELYARNEHTDEWFLVKTYPFKAYSGKLGPKLKEGDRQIPEGIYQIEYLNPNSSYHLSLKVNYPNEFDRERAIKDGRDNLGGDIMIHGKDVTIGCIPIGDSSIEEVFFLAEKSIKNGINVIISPRDFRINKNFPSIDLIEWELELYKQISDKLTLEYLQKK